MRVLAQRSLFKKAQLDGWKEWKHLFKVTEEFEEFIEEFLLKKFTEQESVWRYINEAYIIFSILSSILLWHTSRFCQSTTEGKSLR